MKIKKDSAVRIAIYPGSFDPLTLGHCDIIRRSLLFFDKVIVAVLSHPVKAPLFSVAERQKLIDAEFVAENGRVVSASFRGLLVDFVKGYPGAVVIRGLRAVSDFDYEAQMALVNKTLCEDVETFFLMAREQHSYISSTLVKQIASFGGAVDKLVPAVVVRELKKRQKSGRMKGEKQP